MRRLALLLATSVLGTGCIVNDTSPGPGPGGDYGSVNLYWDFARHAPAQQGGFLYYDQSHAGTGTGPCTQSGVDTVRVVPPVGQPTEVSCVYRGVQGITIDGLPAGGQTVRLIGYRGQVAVFDSSVGVNVYPATATDAVATVVGVSGPLDLFAYLAFGTPPGMDYGTCYDALAPDLTYQVRDVVLGKVVDGGTVGCVGGLPVPVFAGDLDLDDYKVRMQGFRRADGALVFDSCWQDVPHFGADTGANGFAPTLYTLPVPTCPPFP